MIASTSVNSPPAPRPCTARSAASIVHRGGERARRRAEDEERDGEQEQLLAAVEVAELAVDRRRDRRGDQVRRGHPRLRREAVEVVGDGADRGTDDRLVERREEHAEQQAGQDRQDLRVGVLTRARAARRIEGPRRRSSRGRWWWSRGGSCAGRWRSRPRRADGPAQGSRTMRKHRMSVDADHMSAGGRARGIGCPAMTTAATAVHAFGDDALGDHDAVGLAAEIRAGRVSRRRRWAPRSSAPAGSTPSWTAWPPTGSTRRVGRGAPRPPRLLRRACPTFVKDNSDVRGLPTQHGTRAFVAAPAAADGDVARSSA